MKCFKACFVCSSSPSGKPVRAPVGATGSKDKINGRSETLETLLSKYSDQELGGKPIKPTPESKEEEAEEEEVRCTRMKKKVTFELPAVYEAPEEVTATASDVESGDVTRIGLRKSAEKVEECENLSSESVFRDKGLLAMQDESSESLFSLSIDSRKQPYGAEVDDEKVTFELPAVYEAPEEVTATASDDESGDVTRIGLRKSAEKVEECENFSSESVFRDKGLLAMQDESSESLFSLSIDSRKQPYGAEVDDEKEVISVQRSEFNAASALDKSSPLIRIENLPQLRSVKARSELRYDDEKENRDEHQQVAVDASLSSWLVIKSETTPPSSSPPRPTSSLSGGKPILGAAATKEKKMQCSYGSNSRRQRLVDMPLLGTVGSYWTHTGRIIMD